jgi:allantoinase
MSPSLIIRGRRVVIAEQQAQLNDPQPLRIIPASVHVANERIIAIKGYDDIETHCEVVTAPEDSIVMPGLVDTHVHINEPGRTDWEGFATATAAAAAGGVTTLVDMPLNSIPPTTTLVGLEEKFEAAKGQCSVDVGFWGGVVPGNTGELNKLFAAGVVGFKCFLIPSGVEEFPDVREADLRLALPELARLGSVLIVHAELPGPIDHACANNAAAGSRSYETFLQSRPAEAENEAVALMIRLSREFGAQVHIVHHSSAQALPMLREAKAGGVSLTAETCPHYLVFAAEEIPDGATEFKCCPPIRDRENREYLWQALMDGTLDMVVSDHSPCPPELKQRERGDFLAAWGGISSLQLRLPVMLTAAEDRRIPFLKVIEWLCTAPSRLAGLQMRKGAIAPGLEADFVILNPNEEFLIDSAMIQHRHKLTPYCGRRVRGKVQKTFLRGRKIYDDGEHSAERTGILLKAR